MKNVTVISLTKEDAKELAIQIARDLFTDGAGHVADRLVMELPDKRLCGGWSRAAVEDRILQHHFLAPIPGRISK